MRAHLSDYRSKTALIWIAGTENNVSQSDSHVLKDGIKGSFRDKSFEDSIKMFVVHLPILIKRFLCLVCRRKSG